MPSPRTKALVLAACLLAGAGAARAAEAPPPARALLIGVQDYPGLPERLHLRAPAGDVERLRAALVQAGLPTSDITVMTERDGARPTRAAVLAALLLNRAAKWPRKVSYAADTRSFLVEGSWAPLAVMMIIFFTRYAIAVTLAMHPELAATLWLPVAVSFAYGLMSGAFLARAVRILGAKS